VAGDQVFHAIHPLPASAHREQPRLQQRLALAHGQVRPDDHADHAVLVLEVDEDRALGRLRALALGDQPGHPDAAAVRATTQFARTEDAPLHQAFAQQRQRMGTQAQAGAAVVGE
jgi:hypothetical protein